MAEERLTLILDGASDRLQKAIQGANKRFEELETASKRSIATTNRELANLRAQADRQIERLNLRLRAARQAFQGLEKGSADAANKLGKNAKGMGAVRKSVKALGDEIERAAERLPEFEGKFKAFSEKAGQRAEKFATRTEKAMGQSRKSIQRAVDVSQRQFKKFADGANKAGNQATKAGAKTEAAGKKFRLLVNPLGRVRKALLDVRTAFLLLGGAAGGQKIIGFASEFEKQLANLDTLLGPTSVSIGDYRGQLDELARVSPKELIDLTKGLYQTISAGIPAVEGAGGAFEVLTQAQKAAVAGLSSTEQAVNVFTATMNAYKNTSVTAADVSDKLFTTVAKGRTVFPELADSFGRVATVANRAGVSIDEALGAVVSLTKAGLSTDEAMTQLRRLILGIIKPAENVKAKFQALGVDFGETALQAMGLSGVLEQVNLATGGSADAFAELFPNVRAMVGALVLGTGGLDDFKVSIDQVRNSTGATDRAYQKIQDTFDTTFKVFKSRLQAVLINAGDRVLPKLRRGLQKLGDVLEKNQEQIARVVDVFATFALGIGEFLAGNGRALLLWATTLLAAFSAKKIIEFRKVFVAEMAKVQAASAAAGANAGGAFVSGFSGASAKLVGVIRALFKSPLILGGAALLGSLIVGTILDAIDTAQGTALRRQREEAEKRSRVRKAESDKAAQAAGFESAEQRRQIQGEALTQARVVITGPRKEDIQPIDDIIKRLSSLPEDEVQRQLFAIAETSKVFLEKELESLDRSRRFTEADIERARSRADKEQQVRAEARLQNLDRERAILERQQATRLKLLRQGVQQQRSDEVAFEKLKERQKEQERAAQKLARARAAQTLAEQDEAARAAQNKRILDDRRDAALAAKAAAEARLAIFDDELAKVLQATRAEAARDRIEQRSLSDRKSLIDEQVKAVESLRDVQREILEEERRAAQEQLRLKLQGIRLNAAGEIANLEREITELADRQQGIVDKRAAKEKELRDEKRSATQKEQALLDKRAKEEADITRTLQARKETLAKNQGTLERTLALVRKQEEAQIPVVENDQRLVALNQELLRLKGQQADIDDRAKALDLADYLRELVEDIAPVELIDEVEVSRSLSRMESVFNDFRKNVRGGQADLLGVVDPDAAQAVGAAGAALAALFKEGVFGPLAAAGQDAAGRALDTAKRLENQLRPIWGDAAETFVDRVTRKFKEGTIFDVPEDVTGLTSRFEQIGLKFRDIFIDEIIPAMRDGLLEAVGNIGESFDVDRLFGSLKSALGGVMDAAIKPLTEGLNKVVPGLGNAIAPLIDALFSFTNKITDALIQPVDTALSAPLNLLLGSFDDAVAALVDVGNLESAFEKQRKEARTEHQQRLLDISREGQQQEQSREEIRQEISKENRRFQEALRDINKQQREASPRDVLKRRVAEAGEVLSRVNQELPDILEDTVDYLLVNVPKFLDEIADTFDRVMERAVGRLEEVVTTSMESFKNFVSRLFDTLFEYMDDIIGILVRDSLAGSVGDIIKVIGGLIALIIRAIDGIVRNLPEIVDKLLSGIFDAIIWLVAQIRKAVFDLIANSLTKLGTLLPTIVKNINKFVVKFVISFVKQTFTQFSNWWDNFDINSVFSDFDWSKLVEQLDGAFAGLLEGLFGDDIGGALDTINGWLEDIAGFFGAEKKTSKDPEGAFYGRRVESAYRQGLITKKERDEAITYGYSSPQAQRNRDAYLDALIEKNRGRQLSPPTRVPRRHSGGRIGAGMRNSGVASSLAAAGAQAFQTGGLVLPDIGNAVRSALRRDEAPAILQVGEGVLNREAMANIGGAGNLSRLNDGDNPQTVFGQGQPVQATVNIQPSGNAVMDALANMLLRSAAVSMTTPGGMLRAAQARGTLPGTKNVRGRS